jgi:dTDP-4-amino-4,6-dideoxygalactose transaminase
VEKEPAHGDMQQVLAFIPAKNLGAYGDAGAMLTNEDELQAVCKDRIANHGQIKKHHHLREGRNSGWTPLQALSYWPSLPYIDQWTNAR